MSIPAEFQLAAAIVLIYLLDCLVLLHVNEGIVERRGRGWRIGFGSVQPWIAGKRIRLLDPLAPQAEAYRAAWHVRGELDAPAVVAAATERLAALAPVWRRLAPFVLVVWALVLVALPLALCASNTAGFLVVAALAWLSVWVLVVRLWGLRGALGLSVGAFVLAAFECLACPPAAANLVRKLSMRSSTGADLVAFVAALPDARSRGAALAHIDADVEARLVFLEPNGTRYAEAVHYRDVLAAERARPDDRADSSAQPAGESQ